MKFGMYIMAPEPISCLDMYSSVVAAQRLGKNVTAAANTHETIEELLYVWFSILFVSYQRKYAISSSQNFML
jgi:hypothetical protein